MRPVSKVVIYHASTWSAFWNYALEHFLDLHFHLYTSSRFDMSLKLLLLRYHVVTLSIDSITRHAATVCRAGHVCGARFILITENETLVLDYILRMITWYQYIVSNTHSQYKSSWVVFITAIDGKCCNCICDQMYVRISPRHYLGAGIITGDDFRLEHAWHMLR